MHITLNNKAEEIAGKDSLTIRELLSIKNYTFKFLVVRVNGKPVPAEAYDTQWVYNGDHVLVLHLISGG